MSKISASKKIVLEDFPSEIRSWLKKLVEPLNRFLEQSYAALVNGLTYSDNLKSKVYQLSLSAGETEKVVSYSLNERPTAVYIGSIRTSSGEAPSAAFSLSWVYINGQINLSFLGLNSLTEYRVTIIAQV